MTKKRKGKTLSIWEEILASLIGVVIGLIIGFIFNGWILSAGEQAGLVLVITIPLSIGGIFTGMFGGWLGAVIATRIVLSRKIKILKWLAIVLGAAMGGILGALLPILLFILINETSM